MAKFTVYVDESGDAGIGRVREGKKPGATPYFVVGAMVCMPAQEILARKTLADFKSTIGKQSWKHATDLGHPEKVLLARKMGSLPVRYFAVISNKFTLEDYKDTIEGDAHKFYNKCVKYLLENVCEYLWSKVESEADISVVLEERNHDYGAMISFLNKVKRNPIHPQSRFLKILNPYSIVTRKKGEDEMLELADFVSFAVFQCTNKAKSNYFIPEPRYFQEISSRFAGDRKGKPLGVGLKCLHRLEQLELDPDIELLFQTTRVRPPSQSSWRGGSIIMNPGARAKNKP